jgi:hypothetical protein
MFLTTGGLTPVVKKCTKLRGCLPCALLHAVSDAELVVNYRLAYIVRAPPLELRYLLVHTIQATQCKLRSTKENAIKTNS